MSKYTEKALELHSKGYNCAQSVACAFADKAGIDEKVLYMMAEGFGAGIGNRKNICGALSGVVMLSGIYSSKGDISTPSKTETYKLSGKIADGFEDKCMAVKCCDIKGMHNGSPTVSCNECIRIAVELAEKYLWQE